MTAAAGNYVLDLAHSVVIARPEHSKVSHLAIRFEVKEASLVWDPANAANIKLEATVSTKPITEPIKFFIPPDAEEWLDTAKFPEAKFASTAVRALPGNKYEIDGQLTLLGKTLPATIHASLIGVGRNIQRSTTIGFTGSMDIDWLAFKGPVGQAVNMGIVPLILDAEFEQRRQTEQAGN